MDHPVVNTVELCAGVGMLGVGIAAGLRHLGIKSRCILFAEREAYPASVLAARIEEGSLDAAPVWFGDFRDAPYAQLRGVVDGIVAGFPCQDLSLAGKRAGLDGHRSGLFFDILDAADACGAWFLALENVSGIASATASVVDEAEGALEERAAARVLGELADRGWNAEWLTLSASDVGASHGRERWFCLAWRVANPAGVSIDIQHGTAMQWRRPGDAEQTGLGGRDLGNTSSQGRQEPGRCNERKLSEEAGSGLHDRPELSGVQLAHPPQHGRHQGRPQPGREQGRPDAAECGCAVADAQRQRRERRGEPGDLACACCQVEGEARQWQRRGPAADGGCDPMADTSGPGCQGSELERALHGNRGGEEAHGPAEQLRRPLFAPGPADPAWAGIIQREPCLAPALAGRLNPAFGEWLMGFPIGWTSAETLGVEINAYRQNLAEELRALLGEHGPCDGEGRPEAQHLRKEGEETGIKASLRDVRNDGEAVDPSRRSELEEQRSVQFEDPVRFVSYVAASLARGDKASATKAALHVLRLGKLSGWGLQHMPDTDQEEWRCLTDNDKAAQIIEASVIVHSKINRAQRLKCIGNGVVPAQAMAAFIVLFRRAGIFRVKA